MRGGPENAQNITTIRPFSRKWAMVSMPLPVMSWYATAHVVKDLEIPVVTFRAAVDMAAVEGRRSHKEQGLRGYELRQFGVYDRNAAHAKGSHRGRALATAYAGAGRGANREASRRRCRPSGTRNTRGTMHTSSADRMKKAWVRVSTSCPV